jgi:hypothetical protein
MKKLILGASLSLLVTAGVLAQGVVAFDNLPNTSTSPTATANGLIFKDTGTGPVLETAATLYGTIYGGVSGTGLAVLSGGSRVLLDAWTPGVYLDDNGASYAVAGVAAGGTAFLQVQIWEGTAASYAAAVAGGSAAGQSGVFSQGVGGGTITTPSLTGLPATILTVPEPGTFALAGLGAAALLIFRRRK